MTYASTGAAMRHSESPGLVSLIVLALTTRASVVAVDHDTPSGEDFTVVALPDTQFYSRDYPENFLAQTEWIASCAATENIAFVTHLGDCVQDGSRDESQWLVADAAYSLLEDPGKTRREAGIPFAIAVGNHDQVGTTRLYNEYFGEDRFLGRPYYGGHLGNDNDDHFELFSAGGSDYLIVHLEYDADANAAPIDWADHILKVHRDRWAIVVSHFLIEAREQGEFGHQGHAIYSRLRGNPNLFLMLCGHWCEEGLRVDSFGERTVHTLLSDYQCRENGGDGWLRMMRFSPVEGQITIQTYSPILDRFETDDTSEFTIPFEPTCGPCVGDLQGDGRVDWLDLLAILADWGACPSPPTPCSSDIDGDDTVGTADVLEILFRWGSCR